MGSIQYVPDPLATLRELTALRPRHFVLGRFPWWTGTQFVGIQTSALSRNGIGPMPPYIADREIKFPITFANHDDVLRLFDHYECAFVAGSPGRTWDYHIRDQQIFQREHANCLIVVSAYGSWASWVPKGFVGCHAYVGGRGERWRCSVCLGDTRTPDSGGVASLNQWEAALFESAFTHQNAQKRLTTHSEGFIGLWRELAGKKSFPSRYLAPADQTRGDYLSL